MGQVKRGSTIYCCALTHNSSLVRIKFCVWRQFTAPRLEIWKGRWNSSGLSSGQGYYECRIVVCRALKDDIYKYKEGRNFQSHKKIVQLFFFFLQSGELFWYIIVQWRCIGKWGAWICIWAFTVMKVFCWVTDAFSSTRWKACKAKVNKSFLQYSLQKIQAAVNGATLLLVHARVLVYWHMCGCVLTCANKHMYVCF